MKASTLLALTAGQTAHLTALCEKLATAIDDRDAAREAAVYVERCLREIATQVLPANPAIMPDQPMWPTRTAVQTIACVQELRARIAALEASLASACAKVQQ